MSSFFTKFDDISSVQSVFFHVLLHARKCKLVYNLDQVVHLSLRPFFIRFMQSSHHVYHLLYCVNNLNFLAIWLLIFNVHPYIMLYQIKYLFTTMNAQPFVPKFLSRELYDSFMRHHRVVLIFAYFCARFAWGWNLDDFTFVNLVGILIWKPFLIKLTYGCIWALNF